MVETLSYEGLTEPWKVELLVRRAKRAGFRGKDLEDVQQELITHVIQFKYDPAKCNGASEATALTALINNKIKHLVRDGLRYGKYLDRFGKIAKQKYEPDDLDLGDLDVRLAIEALPNDEQAVCKALGQGYTKEETQKHLGIGRMKLDRLIRQIHARFSKLGLNLDQR